MRPKKIVAIAIAWVTVPYFGYAAVFDCAEQGILDAIASGGGPHTFNCAGPTTVTTSAELVVDNSVILDGAGYLIVNGGGSHRVLRVEPLVEAELHDMTITGGGGSGQGGGIHNLGLLTLAHVSVSDNRASVGGGIFNNVGAVLNLTNSTISGNEAVPNGGGIFNNTDAMLDVAHSTIAGNTAVLGAAIFNLEGTVILRNSLVSENSAQGSGGGIRNQSGSTTITNSTIEANVAFDGGGIESNSSSYSTGSVTITNSTLTGNRATASIGRGGAIFQRDSSQLMLSNCTVSDNSANRGSAVFAFGTVTLTNCTVSENHAGSGDDVENGLTGELTLTNTLIAGDCGFAGTILSGGGNLESPADTCALTNATDQVGVTATALALDSLSDNGGPTATQALLPGSVAIDAAEPAECPATDQRGEPRPQDGDGDGLARCDIGAFELAPPVLQVEIEIRSAINPRSRGVVPVALLGSATFDVEETDVASLRFGPNEVSPAHDLADVWTYNEHLADMNLDGYMDMMLHFKTQDTGIVCGDTEATLSGLTVDGMAFEGTDSFQTVGCNSNGPGGGAARKAVRLRQQPARLE